MNSYPMKYNPHGYNNLSGFSLSSITSGNMLPILILGGLAYFVMNSKGGSSGSLIHRKSVQEQLDKVAAEASAKTLEKGALEQLLSAEKTYKEAKNQLSNIRAGKIPAA